MEHTGRGRHLTYSSYSVVGNVTVTINYPPSIINEMGGSGQIVLTTPGGNVPTWGIDIFDFLQGSGTYTISSQLDNHGGIGTPLSPTVVGEIGALITHGNGFIADGFAYPYSAATQRPSRNSGRGS